MLRYLAGLSLMSSALAIAQPAAPDPTQAPVAAEVAAPAPAPEPAEAAEVAEAPKMKKVCRMVEVVGSAIGKTICTMKPVKPSKGAN